MSRVIEVTFIRHAESDENTKVQALCDIIRQLLSFRLPTVGQLCLALRILEFDLDSKVTVNGRRQVADMKSILDNDKFWDLFDGYDRIVYSPMRRTTDTCFGLLPTQLHDRCVSLEVLRELSPVELVLKYLVRKRNIAFERWLCESTHKRIVVVGHCHYLSELLGMKTFMRNCDVWRSSVTITGSDACRWTAPTLLYRTQLSPPHPIYTLMSILSKKDSDSIDLDEDTPVASASSTNNRNIGDNVTDDLDDDDDDTSEPTCRICHAKQSEAPTLKIIRPCLCSGSVSHVHVQCLNTWRQTSPSAYYACSVCKYRYLLHRTYLAQLCMNESMVFALSAIMVLGLCFVTGLLIQCYFRASNVLGNNPNNPSQPIDPVDFVCEKLEIDLFIVKRYCHLLPSLNNHLLQVQRSHQYSLFSRIKAYFRFATSPWPRIIFLCSFISNSVLYEVAAVFLLGCLAIGCMGFFGYVAALCIQQFQLMRQGGHGNVGAIVINVAILVMWLSSMAVRSMGRLCLVVGCLIAIRELYTRLVVYARVLSHKLGDRILEPTQSRQLITMCR